MSRYGRRNSSTVAVVTDPSATPRLESDRLLQDMNACRVGGPLQHDWRPAMALMKGSAGVELAHHDERNSFVRLTIDGRSRKIRSVEPSSRGRREVPRQFTTIGSLWRSGGDAVHSVARARTTPSTVRGRRSRVGRRLHSITRDSTEHRRIWLSGGITGRGHRHLHRSLPG